MIHKVDVYKGSILKKDVAYIDSNSFYILIHVTTLEEAQTLAKSLE